MSITTGSGGPFVAPPDTRPSPTRITSDPLKRLAQDFNADPSGTIDSSAAILAAAASGVPIFVQPGVYLCNNIILPANANFFAFPFSIVGGVVGGAIFRKNANGPMFTCNGHNISFFGCNLDGNGANFTGVNLNMGASSSDFRFQHGDNLNAASYPTEWPNSNTGSREIFSYGLFQNLGATLPAFHLPPADTNATDKQIIGIFCGGGDLADLNGCQTVLISHCDMRNLIFGANSHKATVEGCRMATVAADTTVLGTNHTIVGNTHAGRFVVNSVNGFSLIGPNTCVSASVNNDPTSTLIDTFGGITSTPIATKIGNTTGLTSAQIDALYGNTPPDGAILVDSTNNIYLQRAGGKWFKSAALTLIA